MKRLATTKEIAELFDVTTNTIATWAREERIPAIQLGRFWRFDREEIEQFIEDNMQRSMYRDKPED